MVYRGKPSKGCAECRARKTRCDASKPSCGQCRRAGRICSGYRNLQELRLVDQSSEIAIKLSSSTCPKTTPWRSSDSSSDDSEYPANFTSPESTSSDELVALTNFPTSTFWVEGNAKILFFEQYVEGASRKPIVKTELGFVEPLYGSVGTGGMLENIVSALGMAVLQQRHAQDHYLSRLAAHKYSSALRLTHRALQSPILARSDEVLATVLLLGVHEVVTTERSSAKDETLSVHVQGAMRLLQLRGESQMNTNWGGRMVLRTSIEIMNTCLYHRRPIPQNFVKFQRSIRHKMHAAELAVADLEEIAARLCALISRPVQSYSDVAVATFEALVTINQDLYSWTSNSLTHGLSVKHIPIQNADKSFLTHQDSYYNHIAGAIWNTYRCMRIQSSEEMLRIGESWRKVLETAGLLHHIECAPAQIAEMSEGICRSVPYFLGEEGSVHAWSEEPNEPPTMYGGMSILMPLCLAANPERIPPPMHSWLLQQIGRLAHGTGIARARSLLGQRQVMAPAIA